MSRKSKARNREVASRPQHSQPPPRERPEPVARALLQGWLSWLVPVLIALITCAAFLPTLQNQFVDLDDNDNFLDNPHYRGLAWTHLRWMWTTHQGHYIPLTWMTLGLDYLLWGMNPVGYHLMSLLLHAANAVVFFFVVCRILTRALPSLSERGHALAVSAGFAALVFAIHPLRVESVAWVTERRDVLSGYGSGFYLWKMVGPVNLSPLYELPRTMDPVAPAFILSYALVLAITAIVLALRRPVPGLLAAWLAYVVVLSPVLGILQSGPQIAADRYTYLAGLGWASLAGAGLLSTWRRWPPFVLTGLAVVLLSGLGTLTWNQVEVWHDSEKLWTHALAIDPKTSMAQFGLGRVLADQGKPAEAIEHYRQALNIKPDYGAAHYNWGVVLGQQGKPAEAIEHYRLALQMRPDSAQAHNNCGLALDDQGKLAEAMEHYRQALEIKPDSVEAHTKIGRASCRERA